MSAESVGERPAVRQEGLPHRRVVDCRRSGYDVYVGRGRDPCSGEPGRWGSPFASAPTVRGVW